MKHSYEKDWSTSVQSGLLRSQNIYRPVTVTVKVPEGQKTGLDWKVFLAAAGVAISLVSCPCYMVIFVRAPALRADVAKSFFAFSFWGGMGMLMMGAGTGTGDGVGELGL